MCYFCSVFKHQVLYINHVVFSLIRVKVVSLKKIEADHHLGHF